MSGEKQANNDSQELEDLPGHQGFQQCPCGESVHWPMTPLELAEHGKHIRESDRERIGHRAYW